MVANLLLVKLSANCSVVRTTRMGIEASKLILPKLTIQVNAVSARNEPLTRLSTFFDQATDSLSSQMYYLDGSGLSGMLDGTWSILPNGM